MPLKSETWATACRDCVGRAWGDKLAAPEGNSSLSVALCGEALGEHEERDQLPFRPQAPAGSLLERAIRLAGFSRSAFTIYNTVNCRPPGNKLDGERYEASAVQSCATYNDRLIAARRPRVIVALGGVPTRALTDFDGSTKQRSVGMVRGWLTPSRVYGSDGHVRTWGDARMPMLILPTLHPSYIQRGAKEFLAVLVHDLRLAVHVARQGLGSPRPTSYQLTPSIDDALSFLERCKREQGRLLCYDIETPWSKEHEEDDDPEASDEGITTIQFSLGVGEGITLPWTGRYREIATEILSQANPKMGCNSWQFDEPRLSVADYHVRGTHHDLRWAFHCLYPDLPTNLQFICSFLSTGMRVLTKDGYDRDAAAEAAWKHTAQTAGSDYSCRDVDMPQRAWPLVVSELHRVGAWRSYEEHTLRVRPILVRATDYGIPVNPEKHDEFSKQLEADLAVGMAGLQAIVPDELKPLEPKGGYKNDKVALKRQALPNQGLEAGEVWVRAEFCVAKIAQDDWFGGKGITVTRWARQQPFLPDSPKQVIALIKHLGDKVPRADDGSGDTTGKTGLERLARQTKRPVYRLILECRALAEMRGTHVEGWKPSNQDVAAGDGLANRVHPCFTFTPATGQLACYGSPNALNPPKPKGQAEKDRLAVSFRRMIEARPGYRLWEFDLKSAHALTLGYEAGCPDYMRLARLDIHSYVAAHLEKLPDVRDCLGWPDDQLTAFLKEVKRRYKSTRDDRAKPSILGLGFGMGYRKLYMMNRESFTGEADAKRVRDMLKSLFPRVFAWQDEVRRLAHQQGFLLSRHGAIRWFQDVYHYDWRRGENVTGEDSEAAIAFLPSNDAFGYLKDAMLRLDEPEFALYRAGLMIPLHDALVFEMRREIEDQAVPRIYQAMTAPSSILDGLSIGASVTCGLNWAEMEEVALPACPSHPTPEAPATA